MHTTSESLKRDKSNNSDLHDSKFEGFPINLEDCGLYKVDNFSCQ